MGKRKCGFIDGMAWMWINGLVAAVFVIVMICHWIRYWTKPKYWIYLTNWTYLIETLYAVCLVASDFFAVHFLELPISPSYKTAFMEAPPLFVKFTVVLYQVALP